jgi:hypothetical protein
MASSKNASGGVQRFPGRRRRTAREEVSDSGQFSEVRAYRKIAASFAQAKQ